MRYLIICLLLCGCGKSGIDEIISSVETIQKEYKVIAKNCFEGGKHCQYIESQGIYTSSCADLEKNCKGLNE